MSLDYMGDFQKFIYNDGNPVIFGKWDWYILGENVEYYLLLKKDVALQERQYVYESRYGDEYDGKLPLTWEETDLCQSIRSWADEAFTDAEKENMDHVTVSSYVKGYAPESYATILSAEQVIKFVPESIRFIYGHVWWLRKENIYSEHEKDNCVLSGKDDHFPDGICSLSIYSEYSVRPVIMVKKQVFPNVKKTIYNRDASEINSCKQPPKQSNDDSVDWLFWIMAIILCLILLLNWRKLFYFSHFKPWHRVCCLYGYRRSLTMGL